MNTKIPQDLPTYFRSQPERFQIRTDNTQKMIHIVLLVVFVGLVIYPSVVPGLPLWLIRTIAVIGAIYAATKAFLLSSDIYNAQTNTKIVQIKIKKFDSSATTEEELLGYLQAGNFRELADRPAKNNQPLQLYVYEDADNKTFYIQLMKYFSPSDFRGISEVVELQGDAYQQNNNFIKAL